MKHAILLQVSEYEIKNKFIQTIFNGVIKEEIGIPIQNRLLLDGIFENMNCCPDSINEEDIYYKWLKINLNSKRITFRYGSKEFYKIEKYPKYYKLSHGLHTCYMTTILTNNYTIKSHDNSELISRDILWKMGGVSRWE